MPRVRAQIVPSSAAWCEDPVGTSFLLALTGSIGTSGEQAAVKASLTNCVSKEQDKSTRKKMADTTGEVASMVMEDDTEQWPEMFPFLFASAKVRPPFTASACLRTLVHALACLR